jgi:hypothetical protein
MGWIEFEGWNVEIDNIAALNRSPEVSRIGLNFEQHPGMICASAEGDVSAYYCILVEVKRRLISGTFNVTVTRGTGEKKVIDLHPSFVIENDVDITSLIQ